MNAEFSFRSVAGTEHNNLSNQKGGTVGQNWVAEEQVKTKIYFWDYKHRLPQYNVPINVLRDGYHIQNESSPVSMHQGYATVSSRLSEAAAGKLPKHQTLGLGRAQAGSFQSKEKTHRKKRKRTKNGEKQKRENRKKMYRHMFTYPKQSSP